jgi:hypothetical protein
MNANGAGHTFTLFDSLNTRLLQTKGSVSLF